MFEPKANEFSKCWHLSAAVPESLTPAGTHQVTHVWCRMPLREKGLKDLLIA